jgi:putative transposase
MFNSHEPNVLHYLTFVCFERVPVFKSDHICQFFVDAVIETRDAHPFKFVAYVLMPDHAHLIVNPLNCNIEVVGRQIKGRSARKSIDWLKENGFYSSLDKLKRRVPGKRKHSYSLWQEKVKSVDLESEKFIRQKIRYIHMNPGRAGLCDHPAKWKWSSYHAYLPHELGDVPIEMDRCWFWTEELEAAKEEREEKNQRRAAVEDRGLNG